MKVTLSDFQGFEGSVVINPLSNIDRYDLLAELDIKISATNTEGDIASAFSDFRKIASLMRHTKDRVESVDLHSPDKGYKSFDDLNEDPEAQNIMLKIMMATMGLQDKKKQKSSKRKRDGSTMVSQN